MSDLPTLRFVKGQPTAAEVAALVAVVAAAPSAHPTDGAPRTLSVWSSRGRLVRPPLRPGPGAWRASAWPR
ncbi:MAG: acyl-CoA carboxylase epsilon subunit [Actinomycetes bacterium]